MKKLAALLVTVVFVFTATAFAFAADSLVIGQGAGSGGKRRRQIFVRVFMFLSVFVCLFAGLDLWPINIFYLAPPVFIAGVLILLKDFRDLRLLFG